MTRERDRIQENASRYKVLNCPCFEKTFGWCQKVDDYGVCENTTDCLTKRVIEKCNSRKGTIMENFAEQILDMFDIEEINK